MNDPLKTAYDNICAEIAKLEAVKAAMEAAGLGTPGSRPSLTSAPARPRGAPHTGPRAPKGALEQAILQALGKTGKLVNREIRAKIKETGYSFSLTPLYVGKTLTRMVHAKQLTLGHTGSRIEYSVAK